MISVLLIANITVFLVFNCMRDNALLLMMLYAYY